MRLLWSLSALAVTVSSVAAFAPVQNQAVVTRASSALNQAVASADVKAKQDASLEKMKANDADASAISKDVSFRAVWKAGLDEAHYWPREDQKAVNNPHIKIIVNGNSMRNPSSHYELR